MTIIHDASDPTSGTDIRWLMKHVRLARGRYAAYLNAFLFRTVIRREKNHNVNYQGPLAPSESERKTILILSGFNIFNTSVKI